MVTLRRRAWFTPKTISERTGPIQHFSPTDCICVMGRRGCGKSYLAKRLQEVWPRRVIIDTLAEYSDAKGRPIFKNAIIVDNFPDFAAKIEELEKQKSKKFVLIYQFHPEAENSEAVFNEICRVCYYFGNIQIVIEEVQMHATTHFLPHWFRELLLTGRHQNNSVMVTSQRPGEINKTIISQCSNIFVGQIIEGNDLKYVSNFLNENSDRLINLPDRKFLWRSSDGKIREISNDF